MSKNDKTVNGNLGSGSDTYKGGQIPPVVDKLPPPPDND